MALPAKRHRAEVAGKLADIPHQRFNTCIRSRWLRRVALERFIHVTDLRDLSGLDREIVTHETVEFAAIGLLPEFELHRTPELLIHPPL